MSKRRAVYDDDDDYDVFGVNNNEYEQRPFKRTAIKPDTPMDISVIRPPSATPMDISVTQPASRVNTPPSATAPAPGSITQPASRVNTPPSAIAPAPALGSITQPASRVNTPPPPPFTPPPLQQSPLPQLLSQQPTPPPTPPEATQTVSMASTAVSNKLPKMIAQGAYGCVYNPSMICNGDEEQEKTGKYGDKISKLMTKDAATKEMYEYDAIENADPEHEFYLGKPEMCRPKIYNNDSIYKGCNVLTKRKYNDEMMLLILKNGGNDLAIYSKKKVATEDYTTAEFELFWLAMYKFLHSLLMLNKHNLIHFDIKPQNIVYDIKTNDMKLIDFGKMQKLSTYTGPDADMAVLNRIEFWWSFPWEMAFISRRKMREIFESLAPFGRQSSSTASFIREQLRKFRNDPQHENFFMITYNIDEDESDKNSTITDLFNNQYSRELDALYRTFANVGQERFDTFYDSFITKSFETFDLYGTGIAMMYFLTRLEEFVVSPTIFKTLLQYVNRILTPNALNRYTVSEAIEALQAIIQRYGWAFKHLDYIQANSKYFGWALGTTATATAATTTTATTSAREGGRGRTYRRRSRYHRRRTQRRTIKR